MALRPPNRFYIQKNGRREFFCATNCAQAQTCRLLFPVYIERGKLETSFSLLCKPILLALRTSWWRSLLCGPNVQTQQPWVSRPFGSLQARFVTWADIGYVNSGPFPVKARICSLAGAQEG